MKNLILLLLALSFSPVASMAAPSAHIYSRSEIFGLAKKIRAKRNALKKSIRVSSIPLVRFYSSPAAPKTGEAVTLFLQMDTSFTDNETIVLGAIDSQSISLDHPANELWVTDLGAFSEIRGHEFKASVYIQNASDAQQIRNAISQLETEVADLNHQIEQATDPAIIEQLTALRDDKIAQKNVLIQALADLKSPVGEEVFSFNIGENTTSPDFPHVSGISPNVVKLNTEKQITISGSNFGASPSVSIGGQALAITSSTPSSIVGTLSGFSSQGAKDVEVRFTASGQVKNAFLKNAFFVTSEDIGVPPHDYAPVAVANAVSGVVEFGAPIAFNSTGSYDPENAAIRYEWRLISKPTGSNLVVPTNPPATTPEFSQISDAAGYYVAELRVFEQGSLQQASYPSLAIVQVNPPVNHTPTGLAPPISTTSGATATSQIMASAEDVGQSLTYTISAAPAKGNASVNSSGLVAFSANLGSSGSDSIGVTITDSGTPNLSTTISIPVSITLNQAPVIPSPLFYTIRSQGGPYQVGLSLSSTATPSGGIVDPDGTIQSVTWSFGDGTQEKTFDAAAATILHNYAATGSFQATLTATDNLGLSSTQQVLVNVINTDIPTAKFSVSPSNGGGGAVPLTITFDASGSSDSTGVTQYRWRWGNVSTEEVTTNPVITHTFTAAGSYPVRLRTRDANLAQGESTVNVTVGSTTTGAPVQAQFKVGPPRQVILGTPFAFDGSRSFNPNVGGTVASYSWNFSDFVTCPGVSGGCTASGPTTSYTYPGLGNIFPSLRVTSGTGANSQSTNQEVFVVNSGNAPHAIMRASAVSGVAPLSVNFDASESYDYEGSVVAYGWIFGDNSSDNGVSATHVYSSPGTYQARLIVTDADGNPHSVTQTISVTAAPRSVARRTSSYDPEREYQRQVLAGACFDGDGEACSNLASMYQEDGDEFTSHQLLIKACALGYEPACEK